MTGLWPHWSRHIWLLALPLLGWLLWKLIHRQKRAGRWQILLPPAFHAVLLKGGHGRDSKLPWVALGLAWLLAVLAMLGPSWQRVETNTQKPVDPLVVMLELTPEMLAADLPPSRLEQARHKLLDLLQARNDAQTAIIVYAGSAHVLVPLSDDLATSRNLLDVLSPALMPEPGERADLALERALALLDQAGQGRGRIVWLGAALNEQERQGMRRVLDQHRSEQGLPDLRLLGFGTPQGAPIVEPDGSFIKDAQGAILLPRLDNASLDDFARQVNGVYRQARLDDNDLNDLGLLQSPQTLRANGELTHLDSWADQGYWLLLPLLLLAACASRRGWLFSLALLMFPALLLAPQSSYAFDFADLWLRPDQQGQRLLDAGHASEAAQHFQDPLWQGMALYQAGDYAAAAQHFAQGRSAIDFYNQGNALAHGGELDAALDAYAQALERQPDLRPALINKALVEEQLRRDADAKRQAQAPQAAAAQSTPPAAAPPVPAPPTGSAVSAAVAGTVAADNGASATPTSTTAQPSNPGAPSNPTAANTTANDSQPGVPSSSPASAPSTPPHSAADPSAANAAANPAAAPGDIAPLADTPHALPASASLAERQQTLEQWLRQIPDNPSELLRRKFWYEQQQHQEPRR